MPMCAYEDGVSLCIIAKNEEKNIARCIASCEHFVDEVVVVDTGSTDYTMQIAKSFGAKVIQVPWENNFAKARNTCLEHATKKWILYLDCDEAMDFEDGFKLQDLLENGEMEAVTLLLNNVLGGHTIMECQSLRVMRNRPEYRFVGRIHEQIFPAIEKRGGRESVEVTELKFYHFGYDEGQANIEAKSKRNLAIFESFPEEEKDGFYYYNFANEYSRINDAETAVKYYYKSLEVGGYDTGYKIFLPIYLVKGLHSLGRFEEAVAYGNEVLEAYPTYKDLQFLMTACYYELGDFKKAKEHLLLYVEYAKHDYGYPEFHLNQDNDIERLLGELEEKSK